MSGTDNRSPVLPDYEPAPPARGTKDDLPDNVRTEIAAKILSAHITGYSWLQNVLMTVAERSIQRNADDAGRTAAIESLGAVIGFLDGYRDIKRLSLHAPLFALWTALNDLNTAGVRHPMFAVSTMSNALPRDRANLHATAAAWSEALKPTGISAEDADGIVARELVGVPTPR